MAEPVCTSKVLGTVVEQTGDSDDDTYDDNRAWDKVKKGLHSVKVLYRSIEEFFILQLQIIAERVLGSWGESLFIFRKQGELAVILRQPGSWGTLSNMNLIIK